MPDYVLLAVGALVPAIAIVIAFAAGHARPDGRVSREPDAGDGTAAASRPAPRDAAGTSTPAPASEAPLMPAPPRRA